MKSPLKTLVLATASAAALATAGAAHATIVNIRAYTTDASAGASVDNPFAAVGSSVNFYNAVTLDLAAGDYTITDAWGQAGALYDAWNFQVGAEGSWASHFMVGARQGGEGMPYTLLIDGSPGVGPYHFGGEASEADASATFLAEPAYSLHLDSETIIGFAAPDTYLPDNLGGISLSVLGVSAVPEPASAALMLAGLAGMAWMAWMAGMAGLARRPRKPSAPVA